MLFYFSSELAPNSIVFDACAGTYNNTLSIINSQGPFTPAIFVAIFLILTRAIEWLSHKSIDLYSFAQMV